MSHAKINDFHVDFLIPCYVHPGMYPTYTHSRLVIRPDDFEKLLLRTLRYLNSFACNQTTD
jgi:hypothetical protein